MQGCRGARCYALSFSRGSGEVWTASGGKFCRPAEGRRNIAEIALHHAYWAGEIERKLAGGTARPFPLEGQDWFDLTGGSRLSWAAVQATVETAQDRLSQTVAEIGAGRRESSLNEGALRSGARDHRPRRIPRRSDSAGQEVGRIGLVGLVG